MEYHKQSNAIVIVSGWEIKQFILESGTVWDGVVYHRDVRMETSDGPWRTDNTRRIDGRRISTPPNTAQCNPGGLLTGKPGNVLDVQ